VRVVDLADEFGLTTAETIDACLWAGVAADGAATELTMDEVARVRELMGGWNEAGFAPWRSPAGDAGPGTPAGAGSGSTGATGSPVGDRARTAGLASVPDPGPDDAGDGEGEDFTSRADRLRRREPNGDGLAAVARENASRKSPDRGDAAPGRDTGGANRPGSMFPEPGSGPTARPGEPSGGLPSRAGARQSNGAPPSTPPTAPSAPAAPAAAAAATSATAATDRLATRPAPPSTQPSVPADRDASRPAPAAVGAAVGVGAATATATASRSALRVGAAEDAPDDDFGPTGAEAEVVGSSEAVPTFNAAFAPVQGGPTGWLPGGPKAKPHLAPLAVIALALAIASLAIPFVPAVVAIVLASTTKDRIERSRGWLTGKPLATAAQVVAGIGVGLWLVLIVGSIAIQDRNQTTQAPDLQVDTGLVAYSDVQAGDCVRLPSIGTINVWHGVSCADPHQAEVIGSLVAGNPKSQGYPGAGPIEATAKEGCRQQLNDYAGTTGDAKRLEVGYAYPSATTWKNQTDRTIYCLTFRSDGALLSGSVKPAPSSPLAPAPAN
jgi:hypothetical protein